MKLMTDKEIEQSIANVKTTLAVENLNINKINIIDGKKYLKGEISSEEAIAHITKHLKNRMLKQ